MSYQISSALCSLRQAAFRAKRAHQRPLSTNMRLCLGLPRTYAHFPRRPSSIQPSLGQRRFKSEASTPSEHKGPGSSTSKIYSFSDVSDLATKPSPNRILIDVREPSELQSTGHIPGAQNMPITSAPEGLFLPAEDFEEKFGWPKPKSTDELVFYCKAGVRSRAAAGIAKTAGWDKIGEYPGSWLDWVKKDGKIEH